jgi:phosphopentomutase
MLGERYQFMSNIKRVILIVLDSFGIGALPDAAEYDDQGANTLAHITQKLGGVSLPNMERLGLGYLGDFKGIERPDNVIGYYGKMDEASPGKDTTTGHWEMIGLVLERPFPLYPQGFPDDLMREFEEKIGSKTLGNYPASGTEIINELGEEHVKTGFPIVYTSADSVFQIAAHEDIIPLEKLYEICRTARSILKGEHELCRVIARPFVGSSGNFSRTPRRRDFSVTPPPSNLLTDLQKSGLPVVAVGKIEDIFVGVGISRSIHTKGNTHGMEVTRRLLDEEKRGLIFTNLIDFDMLYGHRRDAAGYAKALIEFDRWLGDIIPVLKPEDVLMITADHGCDPQHKGFDHTREYVPLLVYTPAVNTGGDLGLRSSHADIGQTIAQIFHTPPLPHGEEFLNQILFKKQ